MLPVDLAALPPGVTYRTAQPMMDPLDLELLQVVVDMDDANEPEDPSEASLTPPSLPSSYEHKLLQDVDSVMYNNLLEQAIDLEPSGSSYWHLMRKLVKKLKTEEHLRKLYGVVHDRQEHLRGKVRKSVRQRIKVGDTVRFPGKRKDGILQGIVRQKLKKNLWVEVVTAAKGKVRWTVDPATVTVIQGARPSSGVSASAGQGAVQAVK